MGQIVHDTIILERAINAPVAAVWNAYADPIARAQWSVPVGEAMVFDQTDFREGGQDHYRCGPPESLGFHVVVQYNKVTPHSLIVYTETVTTGAELLATGLVTWAFEPSGNTAHVMITNQLVSYVGPGMVEGNRSGHNKALEQLQGFLA